MKHCEKCGAEYDDTARYCPHCGTLNDGYDPTAVKPEGTATEYVPGQQGISEHPMRWHKFQMVMMIVGAVITIIQGFNTITGSNYGADAARVYATFPGLKAADFAYGVAVILVAAFQIFVRNSLNRFERNGPKYLTWLYIVIIAVQLIYWSSVSSITKVNLGSQYIGSVIATAIMMLINGVYYSKRKDLFVN